MKKGNKEYQLLTIESILAILNKINYSAERMIVHGSFAINLDMISNKVLSSLVKSIMIPFYIKDNRIIRILSGTATMEFNLTEYKLNAGDIIIVREGTCIEFKEISDDASAEAMVFVPDKYPTNLTHTNEPVIHIHPSSLEWNEIGHLFYTIYSFALSPEYRRDIIEPLVQALVNCILEINQKSSETTEVKSSVIFDRFINELNTCGTKKQPVTYYADKLCITPQYLSRIVSQVSGKPVTDWINKAVILNARILLRDSSKTVSEIAELLNFPNDSFFCRFFKRETGQTPTQYRKKS